VKPRHALSEVRPVPRRGLSREEAAIYLGISPVKFDDLRRDGKVPAPRLIGERKVWDIHELDLAFDELPRDNAATTKNSWSDR
jgi:hypothetical protein